MRYVLAERIPGDESSKLEFCQNMHGGVSHAVKAHTHHIVSHQACLPALYSRFVHAALMACSGYHNAQNYMCNG